jgi:alpha-tubulin suppressor-like RCC1 family protein
MLVWWRTALVAMLACSAAASIVAATRGPAEREIETVQALPPSGVVWAWGSNAAGLTGSNGHGALLGPVRVPDLVQAVTVSAGRDHSVALSGDGAVWTWGSNRHGQLGREQVTVERYGPPEPVPTLGGIVAVAAGEFHTLAVDQDGRVWAWGLNNAGQVLPDASPDQGTLRTPVHVPMPARVVAVAAGFNFSLALTAEGEVWGWGGDGRGALARRGPGAIGMLPGPVRDLPPIVAIAAGSHHGLAVDEDGRVWGWGANTGGQLGSLALEYHIGPVLVPGLEGIAEVKGGSFYSVARARDGRVWAWGMHGLRAAGDAENREHPRETPTPVPLPLPATAVAAGQFECLVLLVDGTLWGWGVPIQPDDARFSRLPPMPVPVNGLSDLDAVAVGHRHALAVQRSVSPTR